MPDDTSHDRSRDDAPWLRELVDAVPGALYRGRVGPERALVFISGGARTLLGREPAALCAPPPAGGLAACLHPGDAGLAWRVIAEALEADEPFELTYRAVRPDGSIRWVLDRGRGVGSASGRIEYIEGVLQDVSAMHAAQAQLAEREHVGNAIFEQTLQYVGLLDCEGRVVRANRAALSAIGASLHEVVGRPFWETPWWSHDPDLQQWIREAVARARAGEMVRTEVQHRRWDGVYRYVDFSLSPVRDEAGEVVALIPEGHDITERRLAEAALRESEEKLARAFAASPDAITITDLASGLIMDVNDGFEQLFEWRRQEAVGRSSLELGLWANEPDRTRLVKALGSQGRVRDFIAVGRSRSGRLSRCTIAGELVEIAGSQAIILVIRDVTEQVRAEQALRESEERMRLLIENAPDAIVVLDAGAGRLVEANSVALRLFHATRDTLLGRSIEELSPDCQPDGRRSREAARQHILATLSGARPVFEWEHRTLDGRLVPCEVRLIRLPSPDAVLVRGSITDLSQRKRTEHAFRALFEGTAGVSGQAFFDNTVARLTRELDLGVALIAEVDAGHAGALRCLARWQGDAPAACDGVIAGSAIEQVLREPVFYAERGLLARFPDDAFLRELGADSMLAMPVHQRDGALLGLVLVADAEPMRDSEAARLLVAVSAARAAVEIQHRRAEEAIQRANLDLERRVAERTAQLAAANAELESFSYSVSHDLRSPLRAIDGFSRALEEDCAAGLSEDGRDFIRRIRSASQRMGLLIDDLLRLSRAARVEMHPEPVDLSAMAAAVIAEMRQRDPAREVEFMVEAGLSAVGDRALLGILLQNLLDNAWKYTRRVAPARIRFGRAEPVDAAGRGPVFMVRDNGAGFDMRYVGKLFAPFQRLHGPAEFEGTGIGLATVRRIITRHGGRVWIEGAVGQGTTVYFTFGATPV